jgi:transcriptional regulator with GAF, ATPase, and Fis domain
MSAPPDSTLANPERIIVDLQHQLAERTAERDEAQHRLDERTAERDESEAQKVAMAEVLGVINSSPGDLAPVFDAILEKAHKLCGVEYGTLQLYDGEKFRAVARRGFAEPLGIREPYAPDRNSPVQALIDGGRFAQIPDMAQYHSQAPNPRSQAAIEVGIGSLLFLPLRKDHRLLGLISAGRREASPFSEKKIALLENFAAQAVIAMENVRLLGELRQRTEDLEEALEQQTATADVLAVINSSPGDLAPVFEAMLEKATELCEAAFGVLRTWDGERLPFCRRFWQFAAYRMGPQTPSLHTRASIYIGADRRGRVTRYDGRCAAREDLTRLYRNG